MQKYRAGHALCLSVGTTTSDHMNNDPAGYNWSLTRSVTHSDIHFSALSSRVWTSTSLGTSLKRNHSAVMNFLHP